ncbi:MAG: THUMP domain-containing class I SAM-dependent RNA methyltransferase [bacterium]
MQSSKILITCAKGIVPFLKEEIQTLGFSIQEELASAVVTTGTLVDTMKLNLHLRTAQRVLYFLQEFKASSPDEFYRAMMRIKWEDYIPAEGYVCVTSSVHTDTIKDTRFANLKGKDAIVDRINQKRGKRPDSGPARDRSVVFFYWQDKECSIYLDTSGEALYRRGYRRLHGDAPMQETLAAAVILASGWSGTTPFINPMCGSGTLAIEATLLALNRAPGLMRSNYGFMHLNWYNAFEWNKLCKRARETAKKALSCKIIATDHDPKAISVARQNALAANADRWIEFHACDFAETPVPEGAGVVVMNPEYGERMGKVTELEETYGRMGDFLKEKCQGYTGYIFTGNLELAKKIELHTNRRIAFYNGEIECRLLEYQLYQGSRA